MTRGSIIRTELALIFIIASPAWGGRISLSDFDAGYVLLGFDTFPHATPFSTEFEYLGVRFESGEPSGPESGSTNPNDFLQPGESVSPSVLAINAVPISSASSPPNKVIATKIGAGGELLAYDAGSIIVTFLDPIPTIVGFYITDPDFNNNAAFFGPGGLLDLQVLGPGTEATTFVGFEHAGGISRVVVKSSIPGGGGSGGIGVDDLRFGNPVPEPSTGALVALGIAMIAVGRRARHRPAIKTPA